MYRGGDDASLSDGRNSGDQKVIGHHRGNQLRTRQLDAEDAFRRAKHGPERNTDVGQKFRGKSNHHLKTKVMLYTIAFEPPAENAW